MFTPDYTKRLRVCSKDKVCIGIIEENGPFIYSDKSEDNGHYITYGFKKIGTETFIRVME